MWMAEKHLVDFVEDIEQAKEEGASRDQTVTAEVVQRDPENPSVYGH